MNARTFRRRNYFIKKRFQTDFMIRFCLVLFLGVILSTVLLFVFSQDSLTSIYSPGGLEIKKTASAILPSVILTNLITLGVICLCAIGILLFISHRIAGPLYRFEKDLKQMAGGDLNVNTRLRDTDQLKDLAAALNAMSGSIHTKVHDIDQQLEKIQMLNAQGKPVENHLSSLRSRIRENFKLDINA